MLFQPPPQPPSSFEIERSAESSDLFASLPLPALHGFSAMMPPPGLPWALEIPLPNPTKFAPPPPPRPTFSTPQPSNRFFNALILLSRPEDNKITPELLLQGLSELRRLESRTDTYLLELLTAASHNGYSCSIRAADNFFELTIGEGLNAKTLYFLRAGVSESPPLGSNSPLMVERTSAGDYYCAHVLLKLNEAVILPDTSIKTNQFGEPLIGFLHVPRIPRSEARFNKFFEALTEDPFEQQLFSSYRDITAAALRGFYDSTLQSEHSESEIRILLTGFGVFGDGDFAIANNPTAAFLTHNLGENVIQSLYAAFHDRAEPKNRIIKTEMCGPSNSTVLQFRCTMRAGYPDLRVDVAILPASDDSMSNDNPSSLAQVLARVRPHAVIASGAGSHYAFSSEHFGMMLPLNPTFYCEVESSDGGLDRTTGKHCPDKPTTIILAANRALPRAILAGWDALR